MGIYIGIYIVNKESSLYNNEKLMYSYCDWITGLLDSLKPGPEDIWLSHQ